VRLYAEPKQEHFWLLPLGQSDSLAHHRFISASKASVQIELMYNLASLYVMHLVCTTTTEQSFWRYLYGHSTPLPDAEHMAKEFHPVFTQEGPVDLPAYRMFSKIIIGGWASQPFSAQSISKK
jgi:hypothetical protein